MYIKQRCAVVVVVVAVVRSFPCIALEFVSKMQYNSQVRFLMALYEQVYHMRVF